MIKLSKSQKSALARKVARQINDAYEAKCDAYKEELKQTPEYKAQVLSIEGALRKVLEVADEHNILLKKCSLSFNGHSYSSLEDELANHDVHQWAEMQLNGWLYDECCKVYPFRNITSCNVEDDIDLATIDACDVDSLVKKLLEQYD